LSKWERVLHILTFVSLRRRLQLGLMKITTRKELFAMANSKHPALAFGKRILPALRKRLDFLVSSLRVRLPMGGRRGKWPADSGNYIVGLTSFPPRIGAVHLTLRSLLKQSLLPARIVLVLSDVEFPEGNLQLPSNLKRLILKAQVEIEVLYSPGNIRSYKKLIPVLDRWPEATVITVDDDVLYPRSWAASLVEASKAFPDCIVGTRGTEISIVEGVPAPYRTWKPSKTFSPGHGVFLTGRGGILYPPHSLDANVTNWGLAKALCSSGDDIWFKAMAVIGDTRCLRVEAGREFPSNGASQKVALWRANVIGEENDAAFKRVSDHFGLWASY
jgi:hypothetical protein